MASKEAEVGSKLTNDLLTCLICNQVADDQRMLPCIHAFCLKCLETRGANENRNPGEQMPCPTCHSLFDIPTAGFSAIQRDLFVDKLKVFANILSPSACEACSEDDNELAATQLARHFCVQCQQKLCECCSRTHKRSKLYMNHRLFDLENKEMHNDLAQQLVTVFCEKHIEEHLKLYCVPCKKVLCTTCYIEAHQSHDRKSASDVASQFRDLIRAELVRLSTPLTKLSEHKEILDKEHEKIAFNLGNIQTEISKREEAVKKVVQLHALSLLEDIKVRGEGKCKVNEKTRREINTRLVRLRSFNRYCEEMILRGSDSDVCTAAQQLIRKGEDLLEEHRSTAVTWQPQTMTLYFKETDIGEFLRPAGRNIIGRIQDEDGQQVQVLSCTDIEIQKLRKRIFEQEVEIKKEKTSVENLRKVKDKLNKDIKLERGHKEALQAKNKELTDKLKSENLRCSELISEISDLRKKIESSKNQEKVISSLEKQLYTERNETTKQRTTVDELIKTLEKERSGVQLLNVQKDELSKEVQNLKLIHSAEKKRWVNEETRFRKTIKELQEAIEMMKQSTDETIKKLRQEILRVTSQLFEQQDSSLFLSEQVTDFEEKEHKWKAEEYKLTKRIRELENVFAPEEYSRGARNIGNILYKQRPADADYEQASFSSVIRRKYSTQGNISGIAVTKGRLIVASEGSSVIETFSSKTYDFITCFKVKDLVDPVDMIGCSNGFLYILDGKTINDTKEIIKVNSVDYKSLTRWSTGWDSGLLSITAEGNVILTTSDKAELKEYNSDGVLVHRIKVTIVEQFRRSLDDVLHAVKLNTGHYLVSYKISPFCLHFKCICVIDEEGRMFKSEQLDEFLPTYLTTDSSGSVMVAEHGSGRVIQLNSTLDYKRDLISWPGKYPGLGRVQVDDSSKPQLFVSYQDPLSGKSVVRVFNVGPNRMQRWLTAIFKHFDRNLPENRATRAFVRAIRTWTTSDTAVAIDRTMSRAIKVVMFFATLLFLIILIRTNFF